MSDAADLALRFINEHVSKLDHESRKGFRSRARQLYAMAYFENLKSTIAFAYSKAGEDNVKDLLNGNGKFDIKDNKDYAYYLFAVLKFLNDIGIKLDGNISDLMEKIKDKSVENKILNYMKWLKYLAEAKIEGE